MCVMAAWRVSTVRMARVSERGSVMYALGGTGWTWDVSFDFGIEEVEEEDEE